MKTFANVYHLLSISEHLYYINVCGPDLCRRNKTDKGLRKENDSQIQKLV